jgi:heterodisulfide reductase subunit A-like polyferredoxin
MIISTTDLFFLPKRFMLNSAEIRKNQTINRQKTQNQMEINTNIVIIGGGITGLSAREIVKKP